MPNSCIFSDKVNKIYSSQIDLCSFVFTLCPLKMAKKVYTVCMQHADEETRKNIYIVDLVPRQLSHVWHGYFTVSRSQL